METNTINHKNYVIQTTEGTERGIFFRSPLQKVFFDPYNLDDNNKYTKNYLRKIKNPIRRFYEILIGNKDVVNNIDTWLSQIGFGGCQITVFCAPIYFNREYRKLTAVSTSTTDNISSIISYGYESEFNWCSGDCVIEKTTIKLKTGRKLRIKRNEQYHYTYRHIIKDIIDTGNIDK